MKPKNSNVPFFSVKLRADGVDEAGNEYTVEAELENGIEGQLGVTGSMVAIGNTQVTMDDKKYVSAGFPCRPDLWKCPFLDKDHVIAMFFGAGASFSLVEIANWIGEVFSQLGIPTMYDLIGKLDVALGSWDPGSIGAGFELIFWKDQVFFDIGMGTQKLGAVLTGGAVYAKLKNVKSTITQKRAVCT